MRLVFAKMTDVVSVVREVQCPLSVDEVVLPVSDIDLPVKPVENTLALSLVIVKLTLVYSIGEFLHLYQFYAEHYWRDRKKLLSFLVKKTKNQILSIK